MATFTESFTSGDNVPLGDAASTCDLTWLHVEGADPWATFGGGASPRGNVRGLVEFARAEHDLAGSDMYAQVVVTALGGSSQCGPAVRFTSVNPPDPAASTFYGVEVFGNGDILIQKLVAGTRTTIGSGTVAVALPQTLRLEVSGDTLTAFWAGAEAATAVDTDIPAGTRGGLLGFESGGQGLGAVVDSFEVGDLGGGGVTGTMAVTETADTLAASGTVTAPAFTGTVSVTEAADTLAAAGTSGAPGVDGTLAVTEQADTLAAAGTVAGAGITGTVAVTETADTLAASGTSTPPSYVGSLAAVEAADTLAASGTFDFEGIAGSINVAESVDTLAAAGTFTPGIVTGVLNVIEEADILTAAGAHTAPVLGTLAVVEAADQLAAVGTVDNSGVVAPTPPERTYVVPAESRISVVPAESRTATIPREDRRGLVRA